PPWPKRRPCPGAMLPGTLGSGVAGVVAWGGVVAWAGVTAAGAASSRAECVELVRANATPSPARKNPATTATARNSRAVRRRPAPPSGDAGSRIEVGTSLCIDGPLRPTMGREAAGCRVKLGRSWEDPYKTDISGISDSRAQHR